MEQPEDKSSAADETHREVVAILDSGRPLWWQAEKIVGFMCSYEHIGGQAQDAGVDKPFDLRSLDDRIRIDLKTQQGNELDIKEDKPGKQFAAWRQTNQRFIPLQLVLDSLSRGWYVVPGIPRRTSDVVLDPTTTRANVSHPMSPFLIGRCLLGELRQRERYDAMVVELKEALEVVARNREAIQAQLEEEEKEYIASTAVVTLQIPGLLSAVATQFCGSEEAMGKLGSSEKAMRTLGKSEEAMDNLGKSEEAMDNLGKSEKAMRTLGKSEEAMRTLGKSEEAMRTLGKFEEAMDNLAKSEEAMGMLAKSEEAMRSLAKSEEAISKLGNAVKDDPAMLAKLLAILAIAKPGDTDS